MSESNTPLGNNIDDPNATIGKRSALEVLFQDSHLSDPAYSGEDTAKNVADLIDEIINLLKISGVDEDAKLRSIDNLRHIKSTLTKF